MPQVPYDPVPNVAAEDTRIRRPEVEAPPAAFGVNIGQGVERAGEATTQVGNELFDRALWLQNLANENSAREAQNNYAVKSSELHAQFGALTGKDAAQALPKYLQDQADLRRSFGQGLTPLARKMYDADSMPFMQRNIFSAAGHAAEQNKKYTIDTYKDSADLDIKYGGDNPDEDPTEREQRITDKVTHATMLQAGVDDPKSPIVQHAVKDAISAYTFRRIQGMADTGNVDGAEALWQASKGKLSDAHENAVSALIEGKATTLYSTNIANAIYNKNIDPETGEFKLTTTQMQAEVKKETDKHPELVRLEDETMANLDRRINQKFWGDREDQTQTNKQLNNFIIQRNVQSVQELEAYPEGKAILDRMTPFEKAKVQDKINTVWDAIHKTSNAPMMTKIRGMRNGDQEQFLNLDPFDKKLNLSYADIDQILGWQQQDSKQSYDDPRVRRAMGTLWGAYGPQMKDLGLLQRDKNNPDDYDHFTGALQEALTEWREDKGRPASEQEISDVIGPTLFRTHMVSHWWRTGTEDPLYQQWTRPLPTEVPEAWKKTISAKVVAGGGTAPTEAQLYHAYVREQFIKLYGNISAEATAKPGQ